MLFQIRVITGIRARAKSAQTVKKKLHTEDDN